MIKTKLGIDKILTINLPKRKDRRKSVRKSSSRKKGKKRKKKKSRFK